MRGVVDRVIVKKGRFIIVKKAERKRTPLMASLGDLNRPLRVRPVRYMGREWWAIDAEDIWPGMVMDLRRLGFESVAMGEEVLVREGSPSPEVQYEGPNALSGLKPFPPITPSIQIRQQLPEYSPDYVDLTYLDEYEDDEEDFEDEEEYEAEDLDKDYRE
jgi:hypothetical protein